MRVLVTGGRTYSDSGMVYGVLDGMLAAHGSLVIIEGGATGADAHARQWAKDHGIKSITERAIWTDLSQPDAVVKTRKDGSQYDAMAGHRRNQKMLDIHKPDVCVGFSGGTGTADMLRRARAAGVRIVQVAEREQSS